jgi:predicted nucleic acid-binding protein
MICLDASVAVKLIVNEEDSDRALALYQSMLATRQPIVVPPLLPMEITNVLRQKLRRQPELTLGDATSLLTELFALQIQLHNPPELHTLALRLAVMHDLPAAYDAHYLALSELLGCEFWTTDQPLLRQVQVSLPFVRWLGDFVPPGGR